MNTIYDVNYEKKYEIEEWISSIETPDPFFSTILPFPQTRKLFLNSEQDWKDAKQAMGTTKNKFSFGMLTDKTLQNILSQIDSIFYIDKIVLCEYRFCENFCESKISLFEKEDALKKIKPEIYDYFCKE